MASTEDNKLAFVMMVLKNSDMKPDWKAIAAEAGISLPGNAQAKLRKIAQAAGYKLVNGSQIVELDGTEDGFAKSATTTPTKKRKSPTKKEKAAKDESSKQTETPAEPTSKKTKVNQDASDSTQEEVKQEAEGEEA